MGKEQDRLQEQDSQLGQETKYVRGKERVGEQDSKEDEDGIHPYDVDMVLVLLFQ